MTRKNQTVDLYRSCWKEAVKLASSRFLFGEVRTDEEIDATRECNENFLVHALMNTAELMGSELVYRTSRLEEEYRRVMAEAYRFRKVS